MPQEKLSVQLRVKLTPALDQTLRAKARAARRSRSQLIRLFIETVEVSQPVVHWRDRSEDGSDAA